jgi:GT2 family glycosyltransferase
MNSLGNYKIVSIIVHYNEPELCANLVSDLAKILPETHTIIVVDNCSSEDSYNLLKSKIVIPQVEIIRNLKT